MILCLLSVILSLLAWYGVRYVAIKQAKINAYEITRTAPDQVEIYTSEESKIISISKRVFNDFEHANSATIPFYNLRAYITNERLPDFIRFPKGVIETNIQKGYCDNVARMLAFILEQEGFKSTQWNMVTDRGGHSALVVTLSDDREIFIDPYFGGVTIDRNGRPTDLITAQNRFIAGAKLDDLFLRLGKESDEHFYEDFRTMHMAAEGEALTIQAKFLK